MRLRHADYIALAPTLAPLGLWFHRATELHLPRPTILCRLFRHRTTAAEGPTGLRVVCARCGTPAQPEGRLDPAYYLPGQAYYGPWAPPLPDDPDALREALRAAENADHHRPGRVPASPPGTLGIELAVGSAIPTGSEAKFAIGSATTPHTLGVTIRLHRTVMLYLYATGFGQRLQQTLNPTGREARTVAVAVEHGRVWWELLTRHSDPEGWRRSSLPIVPAALRTGKCWRLSAPIASDTGILTLALGDAHPVELQLRRRLTGGHAPGMSQWVASWSTLPGVVMSSTGATRMVSGPDLPVTEAAVRARAWATEALDRLADHLDRLRDDNGLTHLPTPGGEHDA